jgi:hypothetical protein
MATGVTTSREIKERGFEISERKKERENHKIIFKKEIKPATLPFWQRKGVLISTSEHEISGFTPVLGKGTKYLRRKITQNRRIPNLNRKKEYRY